MNGIMYVLVHIIEADLQANFTKTSNEGLNQGKLGVSNMEKTFTKKNKFYSLLLFFWVKRTRCAGMRTDVSLRTDVNA